MATECVQHDSDCRPLFPQFHAPLLGKGFFECDEKLVALAIKSCEQFILKELPIHISKETLALFSILNPTVYKGQLCCGDQFIGSLAQLNKIKKELPKSICVEMEGGAVGQVCYEYDIPYVVIRSISDNANDEAHIDFMTYVSSVAKYYTHDIVYSIINDH